MNGRPQPGERRVAADLVHPLDHVELAQLLNEVVWRIDNRQAARVHELFVEDGSLQIDSVPIVGRAALRQWGEALDVSAQGSIHVISNQRFVPNGRDEANGSSILTTYSGHAEDSSGPGPRAVGVDHDTYVRTADGWRLKSRVWIPQFRR